MLIVAVLFGTKIEMYYSYSTKLLLCTLIYQNVIAYDIHINDIFFVILTRHINFINFVGSYNMIFALDSIHLKPHIFPIEETISAIFIFYFDICNIFMNTISSLTFLIFFFVVSIHICFYLYKLFYRHVIPHVSSFIFPKTKLFVLSY